jgi:protein-S-isoprenylcysteine O-methyltransferase Ste14
LKNPEYAKKRLNSEEEEKQQKIVMTLLILSFLILLCVSGFDYRFHWSHIPVFIVIVFSVVMIGGIIMLFAVMIQNIYASHSVEIQEGQRLIDTGFYSIVRHPMYLAFLIILSSSPVVLGSYYSFIPVFFIIILLTFRIRNEEEVLEKGLKGYDSYMKRVRFRLMPFIW